MRAVVGVVDGRERFSGGSIKVKNDDVVWAVMEPGAGGVEGELRADGPEAAQRTGVEEGEALLESVGIEEGVGGRGSGRDGHREVVEARAFTAVCDEVKRGEVGQLERVDFPALRSLAGDGDSAGDPFALSAYDAGEIHATRVLDEDVEGRRNGDSGQREMRLADAAIKCADELAVNVNLRVVMEAVDGEFA